MQGSTEHANDALVFSYPPISTNTAHVLTLLFAFTYVGSLYISKRARLTFSKNVVGTKAGGPRDKLKDERWRDDPEVIQARLVAVTSATMLCCAVVFALLRSFIGDAANVNEMTVKTTIARLGLRIYPIKIDLVYPHLIAPILFVGPLYAMCIGQRLPFQSRWSYKFDVLSKFLSWQGARNYLVAPITEEIVFRACVISVYHMSGVSSRRLIFLGPLSFGLAHIHHAWDTFNRHGRTAEAAKIALITTLLQLAYTTIFGIYCSYLFVRTGSIYPPISAHIFCNIMGIPEIMWELRAYPRHKKSILFAYIFGVVAFVCTLEPWTRFGGLYWDAERPQGGMSY